MTYWNVSTKVLNHFEWQIYAQQTLYHDKARILSHIAVSFGKGLFCQSIGIHLFMPTQCDFNDLSRDLASSSVSIVDDESLVSLS